MIVGPSTKNKEGYLKELKEKISKNRLNSKVTFTGGVSDIQNVYKLADVYNLSAKPEPFEEQQLRLLVVVLRLWVGIMVAHLRF